MNSKIQKIELNDGHSIPVLGFGTYATEEHLRKKSMESTKIAIDVGFRHIDCSHLYQNEEEIGQAIVSKIEDGTVKREDIFYTSKLWSTSHRPELVRPSLENSLRKLNLDYVDLYLIHFPVSLKAMEKCKDAGLAKSIGVSNFNRRQLERILNKPGLKHRPVCNQVECHLYLNQSKLLAYCKMNDIVLVAYGALGTQRYKYCINEDTPVLLDDPVLCTMAKKYKRTPALIALRYQLERGIVTLAKSFNEERIRENLQVFDFQLASDDMEILDNLDRNLRYFPANMFKAHPNFPFSDEY
ncbi:aldo-keto reductase family 1 member C18 isoform X1 [Rattus rattus]|uniref:aldo-keto reductase family 1 member C18 isoform X1 n=1 Tax=Rattus rattus TaxID=10117 RepID=UPI0013F309D2|nr:aldo-keto reductase family 1 member C18 isoform X1 [Rattus rattus]